MDMIKCILVNDNLEIDRMTLNLKSKEELEDLRKEYSSAAFVVKKGDLKFFMVLNGLVEDRKTKDETTGLYKSLLGRKLIPAIYGKYVKAGTLKNGIRCLLRNEVRKKSNPNIYIIGVDEAIAQKFNEKFIEKNHNPSSTKQTITKPQCQKTAPCPTGNNLADLLYDVEVEPDLESTYVGNEPEIILVRKLITRVAPTKSPVLIIGDTGTGKELVAHGIHKYSRLKKGAKFIPVNCGAIPEELFESEIFGVIRDNVATGVRKKKGLWQEAENGTIFLDEIAELLPKHQTKILRTLETNTIRPVGSLVDIPVNARVVAATNKSLMSLVRMDRFREDLYYRLRGITIRTPSLREHPRDIPILIEYLWKNKIEETRSLSEDVLSRLQRHSWPGNVRELKLVLSDLHILFPNVSILTADHVNAVFQYQGQLVQSEEEWTSTETERQRMESWHHLYRVYEVISAAEMNVRSLLPPSRQDSDLEQTKFELQNRINEIEILRLYPDRFQPEAYYAVAKLQRKIIDFLNLINGDISAAVALMESEGFNEFSSALSCVKKEIESLTNRY